MKSYEERIAELDAKREQKEKELAQLNEQEDIEPIKQLIEYYRNKKLSGQTIYVSQQSSSTTSSDQK